MSDVASQDILNLINGNSKEYQKLKAKRIAANKALLEQLAVMINEFPDLRFSQILANFGFVINTGNLYSEPRAWVDEYYLEPDELLKRVTNTIKEVYNG